MLEIGIVHVQEYHLLANNNYMHQSGKHCRTYKNTIFSQKIQISACSFVYVETATLLYLENVTRCIHINRKL